jgi:hypothetical protein
MDLSGVITPETYFRWFSSSTDADSQLKSVILKNNFQRKTPTFREISNTLFRCDSIYNNYTAPTYINPPMPYPSHIGDRTINVIIDKLGYTPTFGIEVGSFIGSSAIVLGNMLKKTNGVLLCVDTWCGDINMWLMDIFHSTMNKSDGNPKIYDLFVLNMMKNDLINNVIPLRVSSVVAARMLKVLQYDIDFVYVDSAHEAGETFMELMLYHDVLKNKGVLFGDDYHLFPAVKYDVDLFCKSFKYELIFTGEGDTWIIQKNVQ